MGRGSCVPTTFKVFLEKHRKVLERAGKESRYTTLWKDLCDWFGMSVVRCVPCTMYDGTEGTAYCFTYATSDFRDGVGLQCALDHEHDCARFSFKKKFKLFYGRHSTELFYTALTHHLFGLPYVVKPQGNELTEQGDVTQDSDKAENTIITRENDEATVSTKPTTEEKLSCVCSSEKMHEFPTLVNRWSPLTKYIVNASQNTKGGDLLTSWIIPHDLMTEGCLPSLTPFENFLYADLNCEFKIKVNANKFQCGKLLLSWLPVSAYVDPLYNDWHSCLQRPHVFLDLNSNNEGVISCNFQFHKTFIRTLKTGHKAGGVAAGEYGKVLLHVLSPLNVATGQPQNVYLTPYFKFTRGNFGAMSYRVALNPQPQMMGIMSKVVAAERVIRTVGTLVNGDKPAAINREMVICPKPRLNFTGGIGLSDAQPLRLEIDATTSWLQAHHAMVGPTTLNEIQRIWGLLTSFKWSNAQDQGVTLWKCRLDPANLMMQDSGFYSVGTPFEFINSMFMYYHGTMEFRFDFVSTPFHTGTIMFSIEFGRDAPEQDMCGSASTYTKSFDLGEQKTVTVQVPYIYDTVMRRLAVNPYTLLRDYSGTFPADGGQQLLVRSMPNSFLRVRVINQLKPVSTVPAKIEVLVFVRAGQNYTNLGLVQFDAELPAGQTPSTFPVLSDKIQNDKQKVGLKFMSQPPPRVVVQKEIVHKDCKNFKLIMEPVEDERYEWLVNTASVGGRSKEPLTGEEIALLAKRSNDPGDYAILGNDHKYYYWGTPAFVTLLDIGKYQLDVFRRTYVPAESFIRPEVLTKKQKEILSQYARPQGETLDTGEKEDQDETENFGPGVSAKVVQTVENQMSILSILRRPICILSEYEFNPSETSIKTKFILPLMPPDFTFIVPNAIKPPFMGSVLKSPQAAVLSMFRLWRGGMRYTIVMRSGTKPFYIYTIPHSGSRCVGAYNRWKAIQDGATYYRHDHMGAVGLPCELVVPSINPTATVECPYYSELNWTLMHPAHINVPYQWREEGDTNAGHIVFEFLEKVEFDLWWSAADDFALGGFLGTPVVRRRNVYQEAWDDNNPSPQWGFRDLVSWGSVVPSCDSQIVKDLQTILPSSSTCMKISAILAVGAVSYAAVSPLRTLNTILEVNKKTVENMAINMDMTLSSVSNVSGAIEKVATSLMNQIANVLAPLGDVEKCKEAVMKLAVQLVFCVATPDFRTLSHATVSLLMDFGFLNLSTLGAAVLQFTRLFETVVTPTMQGSGDGNIFYDAVVKLSEIILSVIKLPYHALKSKYVEMLAESISDVAMGLTPISKLISMSKIIVRVFRFIKELIIATIVGTDKGGAFAKVLVEKPRFFEKFASKANYYISEQGKKELRLEARARLDFFLHVQIAYKIIEATVSVRDSKAININLIHLCRQLIKISNDLHVTLTNCPVRFEPLVIGLHGPPGVGKSYAAMEISKVILEAIGYEGQSSDVVFVRNAGNNFWNGYTDQPVILFDDFLQLTSQEQIDLQVSDLFALKSSAILNPPKAELEQKEIRANPLVVILLMNNPFPAVEEAVTEAAALWRRRDILVHADSTGEDMVLGSMAHMKFWIHDDPSVNVGQNFNQQEHVTWELFKKQISVRASAYVKQEIDNVQFRLKTLNEVMAAESTLEDMMIDPYSQFSHTLSLATARSRWQNALSPTEYFRISGERVKKKLDDVDNTEYDEVIRELYGILRDEFPTSQGPSMKVWEEAFLPTAMGQHILKTEIEWVYETLESEAREAGRTCDESDGFERNTRDYVRHHVNQCRKGIACSVSKRYKDLLDNSFLYKFMRTYSYTWESQKILVEAYSSTKTIKDAHMTSKYGAESWPLCTGSLVSAGMNTLTRKLQEWVERLIARLCKKKVSPKMCSWCGDEKPAVAKCKSTVGEGTWESHYYCYDCYAFLLKQSPTLVCTACVGHIELRTGFEDQCIIIRGVVRALVTSARLGAHAISIILRAIGHIPAVILSSVPAYNILAAIVGLYMGTGCLEFASRIILAYVYTRTMGEFMYWYPFQHVQEDIFAQGEIDILVRRVTLPEKKVIYKSCYHNKLDPSLMLWLPHKRVWAQYDDELGVTWEVTEHPCQYHGCVFRSTELRQELMEKWAQLPVNRSEVLAQAHMPNELRYKNLPIDFTDEGFDPSGKSKFLSGIIEWIRKSAFGEWWDWLKEKCPMIVVTILKTGTIIGIVGYLVVRVIRTIARFMKGFGDISAEGAASYDDSRTFRTKPHKNLRSYKQLKIKQQPYGQGVDPSTSMAGPLLKNTIILEFEWEGQQKYIIATGLYDHIAITTAHNMYIINKIIAAEIPVLITTQTIVGKGVVYYPSVSDFHMLENDVIVWKTPKQVPLMRDIQNQFVTVDDLVNNALYDQGFVIVPSHLNSTKLPVIKNLQFLSYKELLPVKTEVIPAYNLHDVIEYDLSFPGLCGTLICRATNTRPLIGIHAAGLGSGRNGRGYAIIITRQDIEEIKKAYPQRTAGREEKELGSVANAQSVLPDETIVEVLGTIPHKEVVKQPQKTHIVPSLIQGMVVHEVTTKPVPLTPKEGSYPGSGFSPLISGCAHHGEYIRVVPEEELVGVSKYMNMYLTHKMSMHVKTRAITPLDVTTAIIGIKELEYYDPLDLDTSAGYPWSGRQWTKKNLLKYTRDSDMYPVSVEIHEELAQELARKERLRRERIVPMTIFYDFLKDERKKIEKCNKQGSTRVICMSPTDFTIQVRQYYLHFVALFMKKRLSLPHAVGIAPDGPEWSLLANNLMGISGGRNVVTLDYANFGPGFNTQVAAVAFKAIRHWSKTVGDYTDDDLAMMEIMEEEMLHSVHAMTNLVYAQMCGSPSGSAITVIINSLVNWGYILWAWSKLTGKLLDDFNRLVYLVTYGDDLIMSVDDSIITEFNAITITSFFSRYGITASDATKSKDIVAHQPLTDCTFLKRGFKPHPTLKGQWLAPMAESVIYDCAQWVHDKDSLKAATFENATQSVMLAFGQGPKFFELWRDTVNGALSKVQVDPVLLTWEELNNIFFSPEAQALVIIPSPTFVPPVCTDENEDVFGEVEVMTLVEFIDMNKEVKEVGPRPVHLRAPLKFVE